MKTTVPPEPSPPTVAPACSWCRKPLTDVEAKHLTVCSPCWDTNCRGREAFASGTAIRDAELAKMAPTVAPARPARLVAIETLKDEAFSVARQLDAITTAIERDRASRSPGLDAATVEGWRLALDVISTYHWHDMPALEAFAQVRGIASRALATPPGKAK